MRDAAEFLTSRYGAEPDIEELLETIKDRVAALAESDSYELKVEREALKNAQPNIGYGLIDWFRTIRENPAPNYAAFAKRVVANGDSIITFNYDDSLERELAGTGKWSVGRGYGFDLDAYGPASESVVLKLHGSMNWLASLFGRKNSGWLCLQWSFFRIQPDHPSNRPGFFGLRRIRRSDIPWRRRLPVADPTLQGQEIWI